MSIVSCSQNVAFFTKYEYKLGASRTSSKYLVVYQWYHDESNRTSRIPVEYSSVCCLVGLERPNNNILRQVPRKIPTKYRIPRKILGYYSVNRSFKRFLLGQGRVREDSRKDCLNAGPECENLYDKQQGSNRKFHLFYRNNNGIDY